MNMEFHGLDNDVRVCFYEQDFYVLSNFSSFRLRWRGHDFDTSEAAYHWEKFVHGDEDAQEVCVWFRCDPSPSIAKERRTIAIVGTGHPAPDESEATYLGSAILERGALVLHVFEKA